MTESLAFKKLAAAPEATYILLWSPEDLRETWRSYMT